VDQFSNRSAYQSNLPIGRSGDLSSLISTDLRTYRSTDQDIDLSAIYHAFNLFTCRSDYQYILRSEYLASGQSSNLCSRRSI